MVANLVQGVTQGFKKELEINGVGYRAQMQGKVLKLSLGYSHEVNFEVPEGVMTNGARPLSVLGAGGGVPTVVSMVGAGLVQSSENCTMAYTRAASSTAPRPPAATVAAVVRYQG